MPLLPWLRMVLPVTVNLPPPASIPPALRLPPSAIVLSLNDRHCVCGEGISDVELTASYICNNVVSGDTVIRNRYFSACAIDAAHPVVLDCAVIDSDC